MASMLATMFVPLHSSPPAQALPPHCTLKQSSSCMTINTYTPPLKTPEPVYQTSPSPASRAAQLLRNEFTPSPISGIDSPSFHSNARAKGGQSFKPQKANKGTTSYQLRQFAEATLGSGSLRKAVKLPEGEDENEWLAVNCEKDIPTFGFSADKSTTQSWTSITRSTSSTVPLPSSALPNPVPR